SKIQVFGDDYATEDGTGVRDYVHVTDLADAHVRAADHLYHGRDCVIVNLGSETGLSVRQIIDATRRITGRPIAEETVGRRPGDPAKLVASSAKAKEILGWQPRYSDLDTIIESTWRVYEPLARKNG
ncbi:MAG: GDP-mannose 4,6-dehydratase, partial [Sphaerochaetaceae bacterium]|nr:GDP-mannose 4,6-dehydratase [Sphaerochaetaceae bacterium]